jgi:hypothetical protein
MADPNRQYWNQQFKILQNTWPKPVNFEQCIQICLTLHAMVHSAASLDAGPTSFEDELWQNKHLTEKTFREYHDQNQSIAWKLWHIARIEDMTMNALIAGDRQVFDSSDWFGKMNVQVRDTGNAMDAQEIAALSDRIDMDALKQYRNEVGRKTAKLIASLSAEHLKRRIEPARLEKLLADGDIAAGASGIADYWSRKTCSGLLLMPATRHQLVHLNESIRLLH